MGMVINPAGGLVPNAEGNTTAPKDLKVEGKFGANGATPVGKAAAVASLNAALGAGLLLTELITAVNATNKVVNEQATILKNVGLMA